MTVEEVYVDSFDNFEVDWVEVGANPYLNDSTANYIYTSLDGRYESKFGFPNSAGSNPINSVKIRVEAKIVIVDIGSDAKVYVWDGTSWVYLGDTEATTSYAWHEFDVSAILDTWTKINGAKLRFLSVVWDGYLYVRRATRKVDYGEALPVVKKPIMKIDKGPHPRSRLQFKPSMKNVFG